MAGAARGAETVLAARPGGDEPPATLPPLVGLAALLPLLVGLAAALPRPVGLPGPRTVELLQAAPLPLALTLALATAPARAPIWAPTLALLRLLTKEPAEVEPGNTLPFITPAARLLLAPMMPLPVVLALPWAWTSWIPALEPLDPPALPTIGRLPIEVTGPRPDTAVPLTVLELLPPPPALAILLCPAAICVPTSTAPGAALALVPKKSTSVGCLLAPPKAPPPTDATPETPMPAGLLLLPLAPPPKAPPPTAPELEDPWPGGAKPSTPRGCGGISGTLPLSIVAAPRTDRRIMPGSFAAFGSLARLTGRSGASNTRSPLWAWAISTSSLSE